jgi:ectoine hydroxylase-related dioxygenase (phytanoyl-CoA dioxygenase family)
MGILERGQVEFFRENGYLSTEGLVSPEELTLLRRIFESLFDSRTGRDRGLQFDMLGPDDDEHPAAAPQILCPWKLVPELTHTRLRADGLALARQLLGPHAEFGIDHAILKPAGTQAATPWHQDEAFGNPRYRSESLSIWTPLQEVTEENGCMSFIPASHLGPVLTHRSPGGDPRIHGLECVGDFDPASAVTCPLRAGGATFHTARTLHRAGHNQTDSPRFAYIMIFRTPQIAVPSAREYPWNVEKQTAREVRAQAWEARGGRLGRVRRKLGGVVAKLGIRLAGLTDPNGRRTPPDDRLAVITRDDERPE